MKEKDNIQFEPIPNFNLDESPVDSSPKEKEYDSLYEELHEKCNPDRFMQPFIKEKFDMATDIYAELRKRCSSKYISDRELKDLRDKAESELGIHFSTRKLFKYLVEYCSPDIYTKMKPFPTERVKEASRLYAKILEAKDDIHGLEKIEKEAEPFIKQRKNELHETEKAMQERKRIDLEKKKHKEEKEKRKDRNYCGLIIWMIFVIWGISNCVEGAIILGTIILVICIGLLIIQLYNIFY